MKKYTALVTGITLFALVFTACGNAEAGPAGILGIPGASSTNSESGDVDVTVKDANNQLIGYLVSDNVSAGSYSVFKSSLVGSSVYPNGVFSIGKASHIGPLSSWTGSGLGGITSSYLYYVSNNGIGTPMRSGGTAYSVTYSHWDGSAIQSYPTYYYWAKDTNNDGLPDSVDATASASNRRASYGDLIVGNSLGSFYELKTVTASEIDALKAAAYAKYLAAIGFTSITWPLHLDTTE
jgi:hypothetical protein